MCAVTYARVSSDSVKTQRKVELGEMVSISRHHTASMSNFLVAKCRLMGWLIIKRYSSISGLILYSDFNFLFVNITKYRASSIEHNSGNVWYRRNSGIAAARP